MDVSPYDRALHHPGYSVGAQHWIFCLKFECSFGRKDTVIDHKGIIYAIRGTSVHSYTSKGGYKTLK